jgi:hypothetical protein
MNTSPLKAQVELENGEMVQVSEVRCSSMFTTLVGNNVDILATSKLAISGQEYRIVSSILISIDDEGDPTFACTTGIYFHAEVVYFTAQQWFLHEFCPILRAYSFTLSNVEVCIKACDIIDYKPYYAVSCYSSSCTYKHLVLLHKICSDPIHCR